MNERERERFRELEARVERLEGEREVLMDQVQFARSERTRTANALNAALERARVDRERLDWMETFAMVLILDRTKNPALPGATAATREAIDAARAGEVS